MRDKKGQFIRTTGARRYRSKQFKGRNIQNSHKVWLEHYGELPPKGYVVHHKNENKMDDRIENLELMTYIQHNRFHSHEPWNKNLTLENKKWAEVHRRCLVTRKANQFAKRREIYVLKNKFKLTHKDMAIMFGVSKEQACNNYKIFEKHLKERNLPLWPTEKTKCLLCENKEFTNGLCRKHYEEQNPRSKYFRAKVQEKVCD